MSAIQDSTKYEIWNHLVGKSWNDYCGVEAVNEVAQDQNIVWKHETYIKEWKFQFTQVAEKDHGTAWVSPFRAWDVKWDKLVRFRGEN